MFAGQTWWIVGASEGLGRAIAQQLDAAGARLVLSARSEERLQDLAGELGNATALPLDVTDSDAISAAVAQIGKVDGILYCAGAYDPMPAQEWDADKVELICDVNFMGAIRVVGRVVPQMVAANAGHIVLIGSLAGHTGLPGATGYGASKSAVMHMAENLQADLFQTPIKIQVINPGFIKTRLTEKNDFNMPMIQTPEEAAEACVKAMKSGRFSTSFPAPFAWIFTIGKYLPRTLFLRLIGAGR
ncbi:SDR family NAD(P)-dependent oxidoreductase [Phaeobacter porticola]|uniref:Putative short chain dehydrogenase n=1 Tax=Phaeobacter porticola TaxID=1844006 RepID=A0A1L3I271_9RHOB|nr:SDR family NAD(P)-dependent oxidoreductase [Phaeobacter porticola]APG46192.1 putative short chain dehydrogenase [Phaeobacter porticola]